MIELRGLHKRFSNQTALAGLDLEVRRGEIFGLLGHNGAGKSTAIGIMLGQVWPDAGEARLCGFDVVRDRAHALRDVGAIFETPAFYDYLSGRRNLEILGQYSGPVDKARLSEVIEWVGLRGREGAPVRTYSHGMRARLALAQALLPAPQLLILDEPSDGLDPEGIHEMRQTILRLHRDLQLTLLLSSHFLNEVEQVCSRIAVLKQGVKVFEGTLPEVHRTDSLVHLRADPPAKARELLIAAGLIRKESSPSRIELAPPADVPDVVRCLVEGGIRVHQIHRTQQTLEDFYLHLMRSAGSSPTAVQGPPRQAQASEARPTD